jgi:hypothetical protein
MVNSIYWEVAIPLIACLGEIYLRVVGTDWDDEKDTTSALFPPHERRIIQRRNQKTRTRKEKQCSSTGVLSANSGLEEDDLSNFKAQDLVVRQANQKKYAKSHNAH